MIVVTEPTSGNADLTILDLEQGTHLQRNLDLGSKPGEISKINQVAFDPTSKLMTFGTNLLFVKLFTTTGDYLFNLNVGSQAMKNKLVKNENQLYPGCGR